MGRKKTPPLDTPLGVHRGFVSPPQVHHHSVAADTRLPVLHTVPAGQTAGHRQHRPPVEAGRLDAVVRARRQHRLGRVQGHRARPVAPAGGVP